MVERFKVGNFYFSRDLIIERTNANHRMGKDTEKHMYLIITLRISETMRKTVQSKKSEQQT